MRRRFVFLLAFLALSAITVQAPGIRKPGPGAVRADGAPAKKEYTFRWVYFVAAPMPGETPDGNARPAPISKLLDGKGARIGAKPEEFIRALGAEDPKSSYKLLFSGSAVATEGVPFTVQAGDLPKGPAKPHPPSAKDTVTITSLSDTAVAVQEEGWFWYGIASPSGAHASRTGWKYTTPFEVRVGASYSEAVSGFEDGQIPVFAWCILAGRD